MAGVAAAQLVQKFLKPRWYWLIQRIFINALQIFFDLLLDLVLGTIACHITIHFFLPTPILYGTKHAAQRLVPIKREKWRKKLSDAQNDLAAQIGAHLPYLRRYARALTGSQETGDRYAAAALEAVLADATVLEVGSGGVKTGLFHAFHVVWSSAGAPLGEPDTRFSAIAQSHMAALTPGSREVVLLHSIEGFTEAEIAEIMQIDASSVAGLHQKALEEMNATIAGRIMIIEDEAIIAMDIAAIVREMGHEVTGIASTRTEAGALAAKETPDLILADIQLADKSSGIDAVNDILARFDAIPVIFITAFPERLLTGERPEPAFLITKPYSEDQVRSAVSQAMFFSSTETLNA